MKDPTPPWRAFMLLGLMSIVAHAVTTAQLHPSLAFGCGAIVVAAIAFGIAILLA